MRDRNDPTLVDARLVIQDWLNEFRGLTEPEVRGYFGDASITRLTWEHEEEEHPALEFECHDYTLAFYFYEEEVVNVSFQAMQEML